MHKGYFYASTLASTFQQVICNPRRGRWATPQSFWWWCAAQTLKPVPYNSEPNFRPLKLVHGSTMTAGNQKWLPFAA